LKWFRGIPKRPGSRRPSAADLLETCFLPVRRHYPAAHKVLALPVRKRYRTHARKITKKLNVTTATFIFSASSFSIKTVKRAFLTLPAVSNHAFAHTIRTYNRSLSKRRASSGHVLRLQGRANLRKYSNPMLRRFFINDNKGEGNRVPTQRGKAWPQSLRIGAPGRVMSAIGMPAIDTRREPIPCTVRAC